jgi:hypothetical protein
MRSCLGLELLGCHLDRWGRFATLEWVLEKQPLAGLGCQNNDLAFAHNTMARVGPYTRICKVRAGGCLSYNVVRPVVR